MGSKAVKFSISLTPEQHAKAQAIANRDHEGSLSGYFQYVAETDPTVELRDIIVRLVHILDRSNEDAMKELLGIWPDTPHGRFDQPAILKRFISSLMDLLRTDPDASPEIGFNLALLSHVSKSAKEPEVLTVLKEIRDQLRHLNEPPSQMAADDQAPYPPPEPEAPAAPAKKKPKPPKGQSGATAHLPQPGAKPKPGGESATGS